MAVPTRDTVRLISVGRRVHLDGPRGIGLREARAPP